VEFGNQIPVPDDNGKICRNHIGFPSQVVPLLRRSFANAQTHTVIALEKQEGI